jgi:hypothetical protein
MQGTSFVTVTEVDETAEKIQSVHVDSSGRNNTVIWALNIVFLTVSGRKPKSCVLVVYVHRQRRMQNHLAVT